MDAQQQELYQRIQAYPLDSPDDPHPFSAKLAKENGWSLGYTQRAIDEYRKFTMEQQLFNMLKSRLPTIKSLRIILGLLSRLRRSASLRPASGYPWN